MDIWFLFQVAVNIVLGLGMVVIWAKMKRPPQDDPRLSRGLQLLQSKISVLEDLSDRTDKQVEQLSQLIEQKTRQLQTKIFDAEKQLQKVDHSMHRSLEVAEIFQDKIPHTEIIERQNTVKYVLAAQLAHKGQSVEEILEKVDLPREQIEFIAKVNKEELMFDEEQLPAWAKTQIDRITEDEIEEQEELEAMMTAETFKNMEDHSADDWGVQGLAQDFEVTQPELSNLKKLGEEFRQACVDFDEKQHRFDEEERRLNETPARIAHAAHHLGESIVHQTEKLVHQTEKLGHKIGEKIPDHLGERIGEKISAQTGRLGHKISEKLAGTMAEKIGRKVMESSHDLLHDRQSTHSTSAPAPAPSAKPSAAPMSFGAIGSGAAAPASTAAAAVTSANPQRSGRFLPIQPEVVAESRAEKASRPVGKTKVLSASNFEDSAKMRVSEVPNNEIKKVLFPRIDMDDNLG